MNNTDIIYYIEDRYDWKRNWKVAVKQVARTIVWHYRYARFVVRYKQIPDLG